MSEDTLSSQWSSLAEYNVFISSPSDMAEERDRALSVLRRLTEDVGIEMGVAFRGLDWRTLDLPLDRRPQQAIFDAFPVETWNFFIGIVGNRFGTPSGAFNAMRQQPFESGTEEEFATALRRSWAHQAPIMLLFRANRPLSPEAGREQVARVDAFFTLVQTGPYGGIGGHYNFGTAAEFEERLYRELLMAFADFMM